MNAFCGIDWSERHHDVAVVDEAGKLLVKARVNNDAAGLRQLLELLVGVGETPSNPIPVAIERSRGLLVACLRGTGRQVFAINPLAVSRYRDRHSAAGKKSDHGGRTGAGEHPAHGPGCPPGGCQPTPRSARPLRSWPVLNRTRCGTACNWVSASAHCFTSTMRPPWKPSLPCPTAV